MSNTDKELYEWAWEEISNGDVIDRLVDELERYLKCYKKLQESSEYDAYQSRRTMSIDISYAPLIIEALEKLR